MNKRIIPILISLMSVALLGIVFIQYRWIDRAIGEKQQLIDNNVYQAINEVEQKLNDHRAMTFASNPDLSTFSFQHTSGTVGIGFQDEERVIDIAQPDSNVRMEIQVMTTDNIEHIQNTGDTTHVLRHKIERHVNTDLDSVSWIEIEEGLGQLESVINRIQLEIHSEKDYRLDSAYFADVLNRELKSNGLGQPETWGVWDTQKDNYKIVPANNKDAAYKLPLFTGDVVNPGRYELHLNLGNDNLIWNEIWPMVIMSLLFILVISGVFAYSIKLAIKHKNISQIKSDFINNMTHEFKTPLASISLAADSLTHPRTELTKENVKKYVDIIQAEKNRLNAQVERILEVAALSKDALHLPVECVNLSEVMENAVKKFQLQVEQEKINLKYTAVAGMNVSANAFHLENVLVNLIENGIKYSEEKPDINIEIDEETGLIKISDKGIGMDSKQLSKVFDNFYRVQTGNLHDTKGFGLGLSYCKLVVEKMGGEIYLQSKPRSGTTAIIQLKRA